MSIVSTLITSAFLQFDFINFKASFTGEIFSWLAFCFVFPQFEIPRRKFTSVSCNFCNIFIFNNQPVIEHSQIPKLLGNTYTIMCTKEVIIITSVSSLNCLKFSVLTLVLKRRKIVLNMKERFSDVIISLCRNIPLLLRKWTHNSQFGTSTLVWVERKLVVLVTTFCCLYLPKLFSIMASTKIIVFFVKRQAFEKLHDLKSIQA